MINKLWEAFRQWAVNKWFTVFPIGKHYFKCASCGNVYKKARSEEEAWADAEKLWGPDIRNKDFVVHCYTCHHEQVITPMN